ncbi:hypothetical protein ACJD0Z_12125 [Flavobacteriaceae bacterium M23B6Z8]
MKYSKYSLKNDHIRFEHYPFYFSSLKKHPLLTLDRIKEINLNTAPPSILIDQGEVIFFRHENTEAIKAFGKRNKLPVADRIDVWELICQEFLDTEINPETLKRNEEKLIALGFTREELTNIKKRIKWSFIGTLEWNYLGHWDLLAMKQYRSLTYRFIGRKFYWWTMDIANKGYEIRT